VNEHRNRHESLPWHRTCSANAWKTDDVARIKGQL
jgi:hypothetical protein